MEMKPSTYAARRLPYLGTLLLAGPDARAFLQGQLSADLDALAPGHAQLASCNSAQGRVQAVLWLVQREDGIALVLPQALTQTIAARLRKYVLRSKVRIDADTLVCATLARDALPAGIGLREPRAHLERERTSYLNLPGHAAVLVLAPAAALDPSAPEASAQAWQLEDIRAGVPQIDPQTHEAFVAQMLNLDLLGAISFEKGCYTGQEIIARTHFRGTIKRRMFRYAAECPPPAPGTRILAPASAAGGGGSDDAPPVHAGQVVNAASVGGPDERRCELLAVIGKAQLAQPLTLEGAPEVPLERLELPYEVES